MPNPTSSFNQSSNHSTLPRQNHPPDCSSTRRFCPPETKPPSKSRPTAPISTTIPISGGRYCTGRAKTLPKTGATGEIRGSTDEKGRGKFDPSRCGGHKNTENAATFSEFLGQEDKLSPALPSIERGAQQAAIYRYEGGFCLAPRNPENALVFSPSRDKITLPIPANCPPYRPQFPSREGATAPGGRKCRVT